MKPVEEIARQPICARCEATTYDKCSYPERCSGIWGKDAAGELFHVERTPEQEDANKDRIYLEHMTVRQFEAEVAEAVAAAVKARAVIAALDAVRGWRPIETAPDGGIVLVSDGKTVTAVLSDARWWRFIRQEGTLLRWTHWMPLPPAPEDAP